MVVLLCCERVCVSVCEVSVCVSVRVTLQASVFYWSCYDLQGELGGLLVADSFDPGRCDHVGLRADQVEEEP